jgi:uncharacterized protein
MMDTNIGTEKKADPTEVAKLGFDAMIDGESSMIPGLSNKLRVAAASVMPSCAAAQRHRKKAEPGTAKHH